MREVFDEGMFFTHSPEIRITCTMDKADFLRSVREQAQAQTEKGTLMHPFQRASSDHERDGHLTRLRGVDMMDDFLREMGKSAVTYYHGKVCATKASCRMH